MKESRSYRIESDHAGVTVESYLKDVLQYSGRQIQKLTRLGGILLNHKKVFLQKKVKPGDVLQVPVLSDRSYGVIPEEGPLDILYEDNELIILNKPPRRLVHPTGQTISGTLSNYLAGYFKSKDQVFTIRPLHRLDRETTGCVAFAKTPRTQERIEQQLRAGTFKRSYWAIVEGIPEQPSGVIDRPIGPYPGKPNRRMISPLGEQAVTHYRVLSQGAGLSLLELTLETGRTHQIRVHLASIGYPVLGDKMYGKSSPLIDRQALHALSLQFLHPGDEREICVQAPLPPDFQRICLVFA